MNDLQQEFIRQSVADLQSLAEKSRSYENGNLPEELQREIFRLLHTIKGTSQIFGLSASAHLAHTLENLLAAVKSETLAANDSKLLAPQGIEILAETLVKKNFQIPAPFAEKIQSFQTKSSPENNSNDDLPEFPGEFSALLSAREKSAVSGALKNSKNVGVLEIGFEAANFAEKFKHFRAELAEKSEIIAALPSAKFAALGKIGFRIVYATGESIETIARASNAEILYQTDTPSPDNLSGVLKQIAAYGKILARRVGKTVEFEIFGDAEKASPALLKIVFEALAHLVRNAVSHAFDERGKIVIEIKTAENNLILKFADDGNGLDAGKIRSKALEKNLIANARDLSETETINLIFAPDFSTADEVSDVSGRGVGLDAVKTAVENAGGEISVKSKTGAGTTFEICLPMEFPPQRHRET